MNVIAYLIKVFIECFLLQFKTKGGSQLKEYCLSLTKEDCRRQSGSFIACEKVLNRLCLAVVC